jgi:large subunit ribosomal protein L1
MGKKAVAILGTEDEEAAKKKAAVKREQKKLRKGEGPKTEESNVEEVLSGAPPAPEEKKSVKKVRVRSKNYQTFKSKVDVTRTYSLTDGIKLLREVSYAKFDPSVELHLSLKDKGISKDVEMPHSTGKVKRIAIASDETLAKIEKGQIDFDVLLASADQMPKIVKFAKVLGPKGLMPNPKTGTVVPNPEKSAKEMSGKNSLYLKTEKDAPLIHTTIGKLSMSDKDLTDNISAVTGALSGKTVKIVLKSSMSPAIKLTV